MLYPLVPKDAAGWAVAVGIGVVATVWAVGSGLAIGWLGRQTRQRLLCNAVAVALALSLGAGIFMLALYRQDVLAAHFSYFGR